MSGRKVLICPILHSFLFGLVLTAGINAQPLNSVFNKLDQTNGLPELNNIYYSQSSDGFTWVSSFEGLSRFDGKSVKLYIPYLQQGGKKIKEAGISSHVYEDSDRNKWFTTLGAVHRISAVTDSITSRRLLMENGDSVAANHNAFHFDSDANLWIIAGDYLHKLNTKTGKDSLLHPLSAFVCYAMEGPSGQVSRLLMPLMTAPGVEIVEYKPDGSHVRTTYFGANDPNGLPPAFVYFLYPENDSTVWIPSMAGLIRFNPLKPKEYKLFVHSEAQTTFSYCSAASWRDSLLWVASVREGLFLFNKNSGEFLSQDTLFQVENHMRVVRRVNNLMVDAHENLWLATWGKGIIFTSLKNQKFAHFLRPDGSNPLESESVTSVAEDSKGRIWCALPEKGVKVLDGRGKVLKIFPPSAFNGQQPFHLLADADGDLWVLTYRSIFKGDFEKGFQLFSRSENELQKIVQVSPDGFLVLSFAGLHYINKYRKQATGLMKNLIVPINTPYQLFKDNSSRIYISDGADGLNIFKWQQGQIDSVAAVTGVGYITEMAESGNREVLWLASSKGLLKFLPDKNFAVEYIRDADGLLDQTINSVFISRSGSVWVSSNNGLYKYDPATNRAKRYSESDGLQSAQFLPSSGCQLTGGKICFGGINGLNVFDPETVRDYSTAPVIHLTEIIINNKDTLKGQNINYLTEWTFPFSQNTIQIDFTGIEYGAPNEVVFSYFLKGYDIDTIYGGTNGTARYTRLPKGNYTLQIFAANSDGVWASQPKEFKIRVLPHWTDTWWFKSIVAVFILALLYAYYRFRVDQIKKQEEMRRKEAEFKQKEAEFRQKEAEYKQLVAETETAVLRLQMNPHFIFNSMNSINSYILQRDIDTASDYLGRFAKLMRMILKYAANKYISVSDEIELLELYLQTEAMRFEQRFTYHFEVDEMLDPDEVVLPTMILQPFVENAIWHGLSKKTSGGRVVISFQKQNGSLACSVEDNGIGRQAAEAQKDRSKGHESKALAITAQRLKLLEKEENSPAHIEMIDLTNDENQASGTKVVLILPFL